MAGPSGIESIWGKLIYTLPNPDSSNNEGPVQQLSDVKGSRFIIGRGVDCNLQISLKMISARHCYLERGSNDEVLLYDTSTNGTFVNDNKVSNGQCKEVKDGDKLFLVRKKTKREQDFFLIFQLCDHPDNNITCTSTSGLKKKVGPVNTAQGGSPSNKRRKTEDKDVENDVLTVKVKSEPLDPAEEVGSSTIETANPKSDSIPELPNSEETVGTTSAISVKSEMAVETDAVNVSSSFRNSEESERKLSDATTVKTELADPIHSTESSTKTTVKSKESTNQTSDEHNTETTEKQETKANKPDDDLEEMFKCSLCLEVLEDPICLQPCMHCYCAGCYSEWMVYSQECPQCRCFVDRLAKNHMISSLVEAYLKSHPDKQRSPEKSKSANSATLLANPRRTLCPIGCECDVCKEANTSSQGSQDSVVSSVINMPPYSSWSHSGPCAQCKGAQHLFGNSKVDQQDDQAGAGCSTNVVTAPFTCDPNQQHITCACCLKLMPDRRNEANVKPQQCSLCKKIYCDMYWKCTKLGCPGCLNKFLDLKFSSADLSNIINYNIVETRILMDYCGSKNMTSAEVVKECIKLLDNGNSGIVINLHTDSVLCYACGLLYLRTLAYNYRKEVPEDLLPAAVTNRPDCYWGLNCRTQKHSMSHAQRFNHICAQTRF